MDGTKSRLGRTLTGLGALWMAWSLVAGMIEPAPDWATLPFLPGLLFFFLGRGLARSTREEEPSTGGTPSWQQPPAEMSRPAPAPPRPRPRPESRQDEPRANPPDEPKPAIEDDSLPDLANLEQEILDLAPPKTSAEMVAEARERYAPRPVERPAGDGT